MTVETIVNPELHPTPFTGLYVWEANTLTQGDVSGGTMNIEVQVTQLNARNRWWSIDKLIADSDEAIVSTMRFLTTRKRLGTLGTGLEIRESPVAQADTVGFVGEFRSFRRIVTFLPQVLTGDVKLAALRWSLNANGVSYRFAVSGMMMRPSEITDDAEKRVAWSLFQVGLTQG